MNTFTHWNIARLAVGNVEKLYPEYKLGRIDKLLFCLGSIEPDLSAMHFLHPHYYEKSADYLYSEIKRRNRKNKPISVYSLGQFAHYFCDFCCYAHIEEFDGRLIDHIVYEYEVNKYLNENYSWLDRKEVALQKYPDIILYLDSTIRRRGKLRHDYLTDIEKSIEISATLVFHARSEQNSSAFDQCFIEKQMAASFEI